MAGDSFSITFAGQIHLIFIFKIDYTMRKTAFILAGLLFVSLTACNNDASSKIENEEGMEEGTEENVDASTVENENAPAFAFETETHDFGKIQEGEKVAYDFVFTNSGESPLIISNAQGSCGCTVPQWPREPVAPGAQDKIHVVFDSSGKPGTQTKEVKLNANTTPNTKVLRITAQVQPAAEQPAEGTPQS